MAAVLNHDRSREEIREAVQDTARTEVTRLERHLPVLVTIAQVDAVVRLSRHGVGFDQVFMVIEKTQATTAGSWPAACGRRC
jgi:hypothetical protein